MSEEKLGEGKFLAERFEANRAHLRAVAYRMLGSTGEVDDAVQETWLRLSRSDTSAVENLGGWLTTVVARVCLDMLRSRKSRREEPMGPHVPEPAAGLDVTEQEAQLVDSIGLALLGGCVLCAPTFGPAVLPGSPPWPAPPRPQRGRSPAPPAAGFREPTRL